MSADVIHWRRRRTARWLSLSLAARGAVEGVVAAMNERGELQLPREGLPTLATVLGRPWTEVEPALREVFASGKLIYDTERLLVIDPTRNERDAEDRQELVERREDARVDGVTYRPLSMSPAAVRARSWRAAKKARELAAREELAQLQLAMFSPQGNLGVRAYASVRANVREPFANALAIEAPPESGVIPASSHPFAREPEPVRATSPSLSDLSSSKKKKREGIPLDPRELPGGWLDRARELRSDVPPDHAARLWAKFATEKSLKFKDWPVVQTRWEGWLERERVAAATPAPAAPPAAPRPAPAPPARPDVPLAPFHFPARLAVPDVEPEAPTTRPRPARRLAPDPMQVAAASRLMAGLFAPLPQAAQRSMSA